MNIKHIDWPKLIHHLMETLVLTQRDLGAKLDTTQQTVSNLCSNRRTPGVKLTVRIAKIVAELDLDIEDFKLNAKECVLIDSGLSKGNTYKSFEPDVKKAYKRLEAYYHEDMYKCKRLIKKLNEHIEFIRSKNA